MSSYAGIEPKARNLFSPPCGEAVGSGWNFGMPDMPLDTPEPSRPQPIWLPRCCGAPRVVFSRSPTDSLHSPVNSKILLPVWCCTQSTFSVSLALQMNDQDQIEVKTVEKTVENSLMWNKVRLRNNLVNFRNLVRAGHETIKWSKPWNLACMVRGAWRWPIRA